LAQQIVLGGFKFVQTKGIALLQEEIIVKEYKCTKKFKNLLQNQQAKINKLGINYPWVKGIQGF
jgi:hypothetical protein